MRARLDLQPKERVLAWADDGAGRPVVATETALHLQRVPPEYARFGWEQIERASYESGNVDGRARETVGRQRRCGYLWGVRASFRSSCVTA